LQKSMHVTRLTIDTSRLTSNQARSIMDEYWDCGIDSVWQDKQAESYRLYGKRLHSTARVDTFVYCLLSQKSVSIFEYHPIRSECSVCGASMILQPWMSKRSVGT
jgi:hypothetical protein